MRYRGRALEREHDAIDRALRALFADVPRPELTPSFARRCADRARPSAAARPLSARQRLILRAYWLMTLTVSGMVVFRTGWPSALSPAAGAMAAAILATVLVPILLLAGLRGGLVALLRRMLALE
jgi:hypothetical protein